MPLPPRGLRREKAAAYLGVSATKFDSLVRAGQIPPPLDFAGVKVWDRKALDGVFGDLPDGDAVNPWDSAA